MKVIVLQEKLKKGLANIERVTGKESTLPILNNILIKAEKNFLDIIATNLETGALWRILSKTEKDGSVVLPAQTFYNFIATLPNKSIEIESNNSLITISSEKSKSVIKGSNPEEFPILPININGESIFMRANVFCEALNQVVNFTSTSSIKPEISGVYLVFKKDSLKVVATDSFRLGEKTINFTKQQNLSKDYSLILPQRAVKEIVSIFSEMPDDIKLYFLPNQITIESTTEEMDRTKIQYVSRLIDGEFPNYEEIIPKEYKTKISFLRKEFLNQIKSASLFSGKLNEVNLKIETQNNEIKVYSQSAELGEYQSEMKLQKITGDDLTISFNYKFLSDGLSAIKEDDCVFEFSSEDGAGVLRPTNDPNFLYILMPIKKN